MRHLKIMKSTSMFVLKKNGRHQKGAVLEEIRALGKWAKRQPLGDHNHLNKAGKEFTSQLKIDIKFQMLHWCVPWPFSYPRTLSQSKVVNETWLRKKTGKDFQELEENRQTHPFHPHPTPKKRNLNPWNKVGTGSLNKRGCCLVY